MVAAEIPEYWAGSDGGRGLLVFMNDGLNG